MHRSVPIEMHDDVRQELIETQFNRFAPFPLFFVFPLLLFVQRINSSSFSFPEMNFYGLADRVEEGRESETMRERE
ncbi:hypothetical protein BDV29DRAFT_177245 [Aspergillus leporis]|jgi:hypothetical protein|uniref:Transmembrane protein n=1 Tax=Aspergillus leporis TaxID=41062 RepID=A0A5N5WXQ7_9EURO|nr:hypothetical protein BDV29DRAFT_177245 [Aspergillus leporis]